MQGAKFRLYFGISIVFSLYYSNPDNRLRPTLMLAWLGPEGGTRSFVVGGRSDGGQRPKSACVGLLRGLSVILIMPRAPPQGDHELEGGERERFRKFF